MNIFSDRTGRAVLVPDVGFPFALKLKNYPGAAIMRSVITNFGLAAAVNIQFMHTLQNLVHVYVFGERMSEITVGGLALPSVCTEEDGGVSGVEQLWDFYQESRASTLSASITVSIGTRISLAGFLTGFGFNCADPVYGLSQWSMKFNFHPPEL